MKCVCAPWIASDSPKFTMTRDFPQSHTGEGIVFGLPHLCECRRSVCYLTHTNMYSIYIVSRTALPNQVRLRATLLKVTKGGKRTPRVDL